MLEFILDVVIKTVFFIVAIIIELCLLVWNFLRLVSSVLFRKHSKKREDK